MMVEDINVKGVQVGKITKASTALAKAHDILAGGKWAKGCLVNTQGAVCADGALRLACGARVVVTEHERFGGGVWTERHLDAPYGVAAYEDAVKVLGLVVTDDESEFPLTDVWAGQAAVWNFNDKKPRTKKQVLAKFKEAEAEARRQERITAKARRQLVAA